MRDVFTIGQIAKICAVAPRTVQKWVDSRRLLGHRIPGSAFRRVYKKDFVDFLHREKLPIPAWVEYNVLLVGSSTCRGLTEPFKSASTWFEAGILFKELNPLVTIIDSLIGEVSNFPKIHFKGKYTVLILQEDMRRKDYSDCGYSLILESNYGALALESYIKECFDLYYSKERLYHGLGADS